MSEPAARDAAAAAAPTTEPEAVEEGPPATAAQLPSEYFMPLEGFDAVRHMLENLPDDGLAVPYLAAQTAQTQQVLDAINSQLSARVMRSYGAFVHGMAQVQELESDLVLTAILCRSARRHLGKVQGDMVNGGLELLNKLRRRQLQTSLVHVLRRLSDLSANLANLESLLRPPMRVLSLPEAAECLALCERSVGELGGLQIVKSVQPRLARASERLNTSHLRALQASCVKFSGEEYEAALLAGMRLGRTSDLCGSVNLCFAEGIKLCTKRVINAHILQAELGNRTGLARSQREQELDRGKYKEVCASLSGDYVDSCLAHTFRALLGVLHSHHEMVTWLQKSQHAARDRLADADAALEAARAAVAAETAATADAAATAMVAGAGSAAGGDEAEEALAVERRKEVIASRQRALSEAAALAEDASTHLKRLEQMWHAVANARPSVWDLMQRRVAVLVSAASMHSLTVEQFVDAVGGIERFVSIGEAFCGGESLGLRTALRLKCKAFLVGFHRERLDELRMRLETEMWRPMPLQPNWQLGHLKELSGLHTPPSSATPRLQCRTLFAAAPDIPAASGGAPPPPPPPSAAAASSASGSPLPPPLPPRYEFAERSFEALRASLGGVVGGAEGGGAGGGGAADGGGQQSAAAAIRSLAETIAETGGDASGGDASGGIDLPPAAAAPAADGGEGGSGGGSSAGLVLCTTALNVARFTGRYVRLMQSLPVIAADCLRALRGVFELYLHVVFATFHTGPPVGTPGFDDAESGVASAALRAALKALHSAVRSENGGGGGMRGSRGGGGGGGGGMGIGSSDGGGGDDTASTLMADVRATFATVSLERLRGPLEAQPLFALGQAVTAMESLRALSSLLGSLQPTLEKALHAGHACAPALASPLSALDALHREVGAPVPLMCTQIYRGVARSLLVLEPAVSAIRNKSWSSKEASSQHSPYVDLLLQLVQQLNASLVSAGVGTVPVHVHIIVLEEAVRHIGEQLVDAYAACKKASDEGRALMLRDLKVLQAALDNLLRRQLLPTGAALSLKHAETYVTALAMPPEQLVAWAGGLQQERRLTYSIKHLSAIVVGIGAGAGSLKKKEQQEIVAALQDLCARPRD
jgi:hypothetical protein